MDPHVRKLRADEGPAFRQSAMVPFLDPFAGDPDQVADFDLWAAKSELDRAWVVDTGDRFAGNCAIYSLDVTLPASPEGRARPSRWPGSPPSASTPPTAVVATSAS